MVEETQHTAEGSKALISPPEGFDAYNAHHPAHDEHEEHEHIHIPPPSFWPLVLSITITMMLSGFLTGPVIGVIGGLLMIGSIIAWGIEGSEAKPNALTDIAVVGHRAPEDLLTNGATVLTSEGLPVGRITRASEHSPLVRAGWIPTRYGYLARRYIDHIENGLIVLNITEDEVRQSANVSTTPAGPGAGKKTLPPADPTANVVTAALPARTKSER